MFRLPSEKAFLFASFDYEALFGQRKGMAHSPHIRAQMNLDSNICMVIVFAMFFGLTWEYTNTHRMIT